MNNYERIKQMSVDEMAEVKILSLPYKGKYYDVLIDKSDYEKIKNEKGNTKCIFYSDDVCRNGDKTRDCLNCARVEYLSLYSLNWDNQERLQKQLQFVTDTLEKVLEAEVYLYKTYIDKTFTGKFDWEHDKVSNHLEKFIKDSIEHIKFIDETNKILYQEKCELIETNKQYKQALQEIKQLTIEAKTKQFVDMEDFWEQILQKCEDVL